MSILKCIGGKHVILLLLVNECSRLMSTAMLKHREKGFKAFVRFKALVEVEKGMKISIG